MVSTPSRRNWTRYEVAQALALYLCLDFGKYHKTNPQVMALAARLGRTPSAVALKLSNLAALDDSLPQKGMANASKTDRAVWADFQQDPAEVLTAYQNNAQTAPDDHLPKHAPFAPHEPPADEMAGFADARARYEARQSDAPTTQSPRRIGQQFFREAILTSYQRRCAITGIDDTRLLVASHIVGWAVDPSHRLNPRNGLCLNALHDRAFDRHLISFDADHKMILRPDLSTATRDQLTKGVSNHLTLPQRFLPDPALMALHREKFAMNA
jgi:DNA (cytosine-5)-methyltransferase 1/putative restriction endonuclease